MQTHRPESRVLRPDKNVATSPEPQKLFQAFPPTPKQIPPPISQIPEKTPQKVAVIANPEVSEKIEKEIISSFSFQKFVGFLPFEIFEKKFELAIKNKQNKGNLPSRKIDIYINKESHSQNDLYAVKTTESDSMALIGRKIQSLMLYNYLINNDICLNVLYYTIGFSEKKITKKNQNLINFSLIMELAESNLADDLAARKNKKMPFSKYELYLLAENLLAILSKLENLKIVHANLKPENFLLVKGKYKLADFNGTIYDKADIFLPSQHSITTKYIPQEIKNKISENQEFEINYSKLDVFSLGAILLECSEGNEADEVASFDQDKIQERINKISSKYDNWFIKILQTMLENDESLRCEIGSVSEIISQHYEEIQKLPLEIKKNKVANTKTLMSKTATIPSNKNKREDILKKNERLKLKNDLIPRKMPNRSITPESPLKELDPDSRYSSLEKKKNKIEITHSKVTSYVSPRAQKDMNKFKFSVKSEPKKSKPSNKNSEEFEIKEIKDLFLEFIEKINKTNPKLINFSLILNHFNIEQLHFEKNLFYQKYIFSNESKLPKKIVSENKRKDGKIVRFYSDHSQEILFNNGARKMIFPDTYSIINFLNNDIKQTFPYEMTIYYYADSQTTQITFEKIGINIYLFKNEQIELHHADGRIEIRLADGTEKHLMITNTK